MCVCYEMCVMHSHTYIEHQLLIFFENCAARARTHTHTHTHTHKNDDTHATFMYIYSKYICI